MKNEELLASPIKKQGSAAEGKANEEFRNNVRPPNLVSKLYIDTAANHPPKGKNTVESGKSGV